MLTSAGFLLCTLTLINAVKLPETFKRCKVSKQLDQGPNECLREAIQDAIVQLSVNGSKELGVYDLDPLRIEKMEVEQGGDSAVTIKLAFSDGEAIGFAGTEVKKVSGKLSSPDKFKMTIEYTVQEMQLLGHYSVEGQIMILPIRGDGNTKLTLTKGSGKIIIKGESQIKNGKEYLKIIGVEMDFKPVKMHIEMGNLFNGDKILGDNMNKFLNDNWEAAYDEVKDTMLGAWSKLLESYVKRIMERVQFKNLFIVE